MYRSREGYLWTAAETTEGLQTAAVQSSSPKIKDHYDVIVIGAGFAGLIAVRDLSRKYNLNVLLIEARDRIGGRTWTAKVLGEDLEIGGTWVHWAQPHLYAELHRYGLHRNLKTSAGTAAPASQSFTPAAGGVEEVSIPDCGSALERVAARVFSIDGLDSRALMTYPHDPLREPALWKKYDHLTMKDRLNALHDVPQRDKELFESIINTFGSAPGVDIGFVEGLRWYALGGYTFAGVMEMVGIYKIGNGGMTAFARAILEEYTGDRLFNTAVSTIRNTSRGVEAISVNGQIFRAKALISTIPLCVSVSCHSPLIVLTLTGDFLGTVLVISNLTLLYLPYAKKLSQTDTSTRAQRFTSSFARPFQVGFGRAMATATLVSFLHSPTTMERSHRGHQGLGALGSDTTGSSPIRRTQSTFWSSSKGI